MIVSVKMYKRTVSTFHPLHFSKASTPSLVLVYPRPTYSHHCSRIHVSDYKKVVDARELICYMRELVICVIILLKQKEEICLKSILRKTSL